MPDIAALLSYSAISLITATIALIATTRWFGGVPRSFPTVPGPIFADASRVYEFREGYLLSPLDADDAFLPEDTDRAKALEVLCRTLSPLNDRLSAAIEALRTRGEAFLLTGQFGPDQLSLAGRVEGDRLILAVGPTDTASGRQVVDRAALSALKTEIRDLRGALDHGRALAWKEAQDGRILWANAPYFSLLDRVSDGAAESAWPLPQVFGDQIDPRPPEGTVRRCQLEGITGGPDAPLWFEVSASPQEDGTLLWSALPIDRLITAEAALRNFVQTLSQTFAHLPIGLAIFDKRRELMMFNPALVNLSTLGPEFLSTRPSLVSFLDALRENQRMPEPKNYRNWRDEIARLEQGAREGSYQELWTLPTGQSYRVIGRPHPDGAVAFMFEDISSEVSLTRKFRGDLDLYQSVLDDTPGALAVFSTETQLVMSNAGYATLWGDGSEDVPAETSLIEATRLWESHCEPTGLWGDIRQFAGRSKERTTWAEELQLRDGRRLLCRVAPLAGGAIAVRFLSVEIDDAEGLVTSFRSPAPKAKLYAAAESPAEFQTRRVGEE